MFALLERYFIGLNVESELTKALQLEVAAARQNNKDCLELRCYLPEDYHLTLVFLGHVSREKHAIMLSAE